MTRRDDPLYAADPRASAEHAHLEALLRCWLRETNTPVAAGPLRVDLPATGLALVTEVTHASPTGWHRFGPVHLTGPAGTLAADPVVAAALVGTEAAARGGARAGGVPAGEVADLVERTAESVRRVAAFVAARKRPTGPPPGVDGFLNTEQGLIFGHLHHPTPKSRDGISAADAARFSPELRGSFRLHWFAADPSVVSHDAVATAPSLAGRDTPTLLADLAELDRAEVAGRVLVPAHPWQARDLVHRPRIARLIEAGLLEPLGELGPAWWPTSSLRTVYRPDAPVMLKLSLGLRVTNSRRESTRAELHRGVEINRLLDAGYAAATQRAHPEFSIVRDPAWLAVDEPGRPEGPEVTGLDVAVREVPAGIDRLHCLAGLVAPHPALRGSPLGGSVRMQDLNGGHGAGAKWLADDAAKWVADYTDRVLVPILHLYAATGIGLEAHQQNTLVRVDGRFRVIGGAYRDNQGYYLATSRLPGVLAALGTTESTLALADDAVVDERLSYYVLRNQALSVVGCLGAEGLADERALLAVMADRLRAALPTLAEAGPDGDRLARRWLESPTLPCKGNLLTRLHGIDELAAPLHAQSVYLDAPNPLCEVAR